MKLEAFDALPVLLPQDVSVFSMDLSGSGRRLVFFGGLTIFWRKTKRECRKRHTLCNPFLVLVVLFGGGVPTFILLRGDVV